MSLAKRFFSFSFWKQADFVPPPFVGILRILNSKTVEYPPDLRADALQLYNRWCHQIFTVDLLRGILTTRSSHRNTDTIDPKWPHKRKADYYGEGELAMGQWWPTQLCTVRDGAHGMAQGGIYGRAGYGAFSVVISGGGGYHDKDTGDEIWYSGTVSNDTAKIQAKNQARSSGFENTLATENTQRLMESCDVIKKPVRVIRSHSQPKKNEYRPEKGFRYDGLYDVVSYNLINEAKGDYTFHLVRCPGQNPIRAQNDVSGRPTPFEIEEYEKLKL